MMFAVSLLLSENLGNVVSLPSGEFGEHLVLKVTGETRVVYDGTFCELPRSIECSVGEYPVQMWVDV